jgi:hypothetical protein
MEKKTLGRNDARVGSVLKSLALAHEALGQKAEAEPLMRRATAILDQSKDSR